MSAKQIAEEDARLHVENIGGIEDTKVRISPGITVLEGRNATNRTSLLQAVMAASGSDSVTIKGDADEATVTLTVGEETYTRTLTRTNGGIQANGEPYLTDPTLADLFAFLVESNEARRAVARADDLRELIMRPIDTGEIESEIERLIEQRRELETELEEINSLKNRLPELEEEQTKLREEIKVKTEELQGKEAEIESLDADIEETRETKTEFEEKLEELGDKRSTLEETRYTLGTEQERLDALINEQQELQAESEDLEETPMGDIQELESEVSRLREEKQALETEINELQTVIQFNEEMLEIDNHELFDAPHGPADSDAPVTDQLLEGTQETCWTCGSEVDHEQIQTTLKRLRELSSGKFEEISDLDDRLDELTSERQTLRKSQRRREQVERRLDDLENEIESQKDTIEDLEARRVELREEIQGIEEEVDELENDSRTEILELHKEANQLEYEIGQLETKLEDVGDEITTIEAELERRSDLKADREAIQKSIEDLRTKIERTEQEAIEAFNGHMETLLDLLDYQNLDRIWLQRTEIEVRDGREKVSKSVFKLHVVRRTKSGTAYEDTIDHLSESEREVTGLVFALAGYLVHDVHEVIPFMLLDSLEAIDSERIATLIEYFSEYSQYLVVALLPEDAAALDGEYQRLTQI